MDFAALWDQALPFDRFVQETAPQHQGLWESVYRTARPPLQRVELPGSTRLLVIAEDWCGDASTTVPILAKWVESQPFWSLRILRRDEHPALMDRYLSGVARSIPIVIALDEGFYELGHWGPRPRELQAWVMANKDRLSNEERHREVRRWYARDRGASTIREVLEAIGGAPAR